MLYHFAVGYAIRQAQNNNHGPNINMNMSSSNLSFNQLNLKSNRSSFSQQQQLGNNATASVHGSSGGLSRHPSSGSLVSSHGMMHLSPSQGHIPMNRMPRMPSNGQLSNYNNSNTGPGNGSATGGPHQNVERSMSSAGGSTMHLGIDDGLSLLYGNNAFPSSSSSNHSLDHSSSATAVVNSNGNSSTGTSSNHNNNNNGNNNHNNSGFLRSSSMQSMTIISQQMPSNPFPGQMVGSGIDGGFQSMGMNRYPRQRSLSGNGNFGGSDQKITDTTVAGTGTVGFIGGLTNTTSFNSFEGLYSNNSSSNFDNRLSSMHRNLSNSLAAAQPHTTAIPRNNGYYQQGNSSSNNLHSNDHQDFFYN